MIPAKDHHNESERLQELESYSVMDSLPEKDYDNLTKLAAEICGTPISLITLLDDKRQWFKSNHGLNVKETPKQHAFCAHAINDKEGMFIVKNARKDKRFHDNPLVTSDPNIQFYAGVPLKTPMGLPLGTLCVIDHKPKTLNDTQIAALEVLCEQVMRLLELRKSKAELERANEELERRNIELQWFVDNAAHDLRSPLGNIWTLTEALERNHIKSMDKKGIEILSMIRMSSKNLKKLIDGLLEHAISVGGHREDVEKIQLTTLRDELEGLFSAESRVNVSLKTDLKHIMANRAALDRILTNLVSNAINYGDRDTTEIELEISENDMEYIFSVADDGPGIPMAFRVKAFQLFETLKNKDRFGRKGTGIGLATVKRTVEKLGGQIAIDLAEGRGTKFAFTIRK